MKINFYKYVADPELARVNKLFLRILDESYKNENWCLLLLLRGMCFKYMKSPLQAEECFKEISTYSGKLKADSYLIPYSLYEYALLMKDAGEVQTASEMLSRARYEILSHFF